jgi:D-beta-D-heptose 7-phosphate kinase/D-beta-D-heptose 1-phosphate adenosyltransferase
MNIDDKKTKPITILIIGEVCMDVFHYCKTERLSPEAPVPVVKIINTEKNAGMAGNVELNLKSLIEENIKIETIYPMGLPMKERYVDERTNHYHLRVDENDTFEQIVFNGHNISKISKSNYIVISDYNKGFLTDEDIKTIRNYNKKAKIFIDTKKIISENVYKSVNYIKINEDEYLKNITTNTYISKRLNFKKNESIYTSQHRISKVIITLGAKGAMHHNILFSQKNPLTTIDVSGAGDTFLSALVASYITYNDICKAIEYANEVSREVVGIRGVSIPSKV